MSMSVSLRCCAVMAERWRSECSLASFAVIDTTTSFSGSHEYTR
jgi:hypothetical protein